MNAASLTLSDQHPGRKPKSRWWLYLKRLIYWLVLPLLSIAALAIGAFLLARQYGENNVSTVRRISDPHGIDALEKVPIGGITQWISIRGHDRRNPVLLFIHGGPGSPTMALSHGFQTPWEEYFTVVQWDQRGAGKTYTSNDPQQIGPTMTIPRIVQDAEELVAYLRQRLDKDKIFVVGHSWGTVVGVNVAKRRPEWLHAYVGVGQAVNMRENERLSYQFALSEARRRNDAEGLKALQSLAPYPPAGSMPLDIILKQRSFVTKYGGFMHDAQGDEKFSALSIVAPEYTLGDLRHQFNGESTMFTLKYLMDPLMQVDLPALGYDFRTPVFMVNGRYDQETPQQLASDYFRHIRAPYKKMIWFDRSGHMPYLEEPAKLSRFLIDEVRPLAADELARFDPAANRYEESSSSSLPQETGSASGAGAP
jgi:proline iminopeptidase